MNEIALREPQNQLTEQMDYARAVAPGSLLPREYKDNPANVLIAVGLGQAMGLSPAESLYRITVIQGKPTASAELIAANVRKAGHKLRVRGDEQSCTATIIRADDPDFEFAVTRDLEWARSMGLLAKDNYKKQPGTMLQWRAITAVARLACPEALYGVAYTSDEVADERPVETSRRVTADEIMAQQSAPAAAEDEPIDGEVVEHQEPSPAQLRMLGTLMTRNGIKDKADRHAYCDRIIGHPIESAKDLTQDEFQAVIAALQAENEPAAAEPAPEQQPLDAADQPPTDPTEGE